jgi:hypothetical protein
LPGRDDRRACSFREHHDHAIQTDDGAIDLEAELEVASTAHLATSSRRLTRVHVFGMNGAGSGLLAA